MPASVRLNPRDRKAARLRAARRLVRCANGSACVDGEGVPRWVCNDIAREMTETGERDPNRARRRIDDRDIEACERGLEEMGFERLAEPQPFVLRGP